MELLGHWQVRVGPGETLFTVGDSSAPGIFIVVEGQLGVFLEDGLQRLQTNTLRAGETVGDLDVLDGVLLLIWNCLHAR